MNKVKNTHHTNGSFYPCLIFIKGYGCIPQSLFCRSTVILWVHWLLTLFLCFSLSSWLKSYCQKSVHITLITIEFQDIVCVYPLPSKKWDLNVGIFQIKLLISYEQNSKDFRHTKKKVWLGRNKFLLLLKYIYEKILIWNLSVKILSQKCTSLH